MGHARSGAAKILMYFTWRAFLFLSEALPKHWPVSFIFMPASYKTCPPYPAGVYSLLIGPKTIGLTALTLSLAHAPNRETLPLKIRPCRPPVFGLQLYFTIWIYFYVFTGNSATQSMTLKGKRTSVILSYRGNVTCFIVSMVK